MYFLSAIYNENIERESGELEGEIQREMLILLRKIVGSEKKNMRIRKTRRLCNIDYEYVSSI